MSNATPIATLEVPGTPWLMTERQIEFLLRGVDGNPSLLDTMGLTLEDAVETYGEVSGKFVIDSMKRDLADARRARKVETMTGKSVTKDEDGQFPFLIRLRMAADAAGGFLAEMVVAELDLTITRCKPSSVVPADRLEVSDAIDYALSMFHATSTPVPPKPESTKPAAATTGSGSLTAYPTN